MKRVLIRLIPCLMFLTVMCSSSFGQYRIATVDMGKAFTNYWKFKQANAALDVQKAELEKSDKEMLENRQKLVEAYNKLLTDSNNQVLSADERAKKSTAAQDKLKEVSDIENRIKDFRTTSMNRLQEQMTRMRDNLLSEVKAAVVARAKVGGFTLVFDTAAQSADRTPIIVYASGDDLTESVLAQLNAGAPANPADTPKK